MSGLSVDERKFLMQWSVRFKFGAKLACLFFVRALIKEEDQDKGSAGMEM